ncbi:non-ribosomal peptide synthetase [Caldalkalibacillus mannanilyticus]|uniref:non-ribosomal peptide synthetase n=1 Tax=Caldalkalibacillus mannanilyticus TaxID=1418 RepID=UPI0006847CED|nr:non-ribosomal peptide synthetase [Caldalkalibacillus mannanilyticus]
MSQMTEIENMYTLTPMQKGMLFHSLAEPESSVYFEQTSFDIEGQFNVKVFEQSLHHLVERHDVLRTIFSMYIPEQPLQIVLEKQHFQVHYEDLSSISTSNQEKYVEMFREKDRHAGFDLTRGPLMRVSVLQKSDVAYHLIWSFHHILMDGWCMSLVIKEVFQMYQQLLEQKRPSLPPVTPYVRYIDWLENQNMEDAAAYWKRYLEGYDLNLNLPGRRKKQAEGYQKEQVVLEITKEQTAQLNHLIQQAQVTQSTLLQMIWGIVLQKYNSSNDVVFGAVVSGRPSEIPGIEEMVGLFINTIPVRITCTEKESFLTCLERSQQLSIESKPYDYYPLYDIQVQSERKQELIHHIMVFENYPVEEQMEKFLDQDYLSLQIRNIQIYEQTNYDFFLMVVPGERISIHFEYNAFVYERQEIERIKGHVAHVIDQVITHPTIPIEEISILSEVEKQQVVFDYNATEAEYPSDKTLHALFEEQVARTPDKIAIEFEGERLTYEKVNKKANQLAFYLRQKGVAADQLVGIMIERSPQMIISILAVLKAGGAYLPLDPQYPEGRIQYMLEDSQTKWLLISEQNRHSALFSGEVINMNNPDLFHPENTSNLESITEPHHLAYVIYTSGTTGKPKGVMIEHRNMVNLLHYQATKTTIPHPAKILQFTTISFDVSYQEIFSALLYGSELHLIHEETRQIPEKLFKRIEESQINVLYLPVSFLKFIFHLPAYVELFPKCVKHIITAGEQLIVSQRLREYLERNHVYLHNHYGPSETHVATTYTINPKQHSEELPPIGHPISNTKILIVDRSLQPVPIGVEGELYISGEAVGRGYYNKPDWTAERFSHNPFCPNERMYRTGDLAKWLPDGTIQYVGRMDDQVKIRGFRIEIGEIESQILNHPSIREAVVTTDKDTEGNHYLVSFFTADEELVIEEVRKNLSRKLPEYMLPTFILQLGSMPLTPNGKVDRSRLPLPDEQPTGRREYVAPTNEMEERLVQMWKEILGIEGERSLGIEDHFFDLGGHSLKATTFVSRVHQEFQVDLTLKELFHYPTIREIALRIQRGRTKKHIEIQPAQQKEYYTLSSAQKRLYILHNLQTDKLSYNMPGALAIEGSIDKEWLEEVFQQLIDRHEALRTSFGIIDGIPHQKIHQEVHFQLEVMKINRETVDEKLRSFIQPFDLEQAPLLRVGLIETGENQYILILDMHHIISDGVTMDLLTQEFALLYNRQSLPEIHIQYKDFSEWQHEFFKSELLIEQKNYWLKQYQGELPTLNLPTDYARPSTFSFKGDRVSVELDINVFQKLARLADKTESTLYMILLSAYYVLLSKYSGQEDIIVGSPIAGRPHADLEKVVGMFVNTLALRSNPIGTKRYIDFLEEVKQMTLSAYENQWYPFEELVESLELNRERSRNPLFDTMFSLQHQNQSTISFNDLQLERFSLDHHFSKFDLTLHVTESEDRLSFSLEYSTSLFKKETMERFLNGYQYVLEQIMADPEKRLAEYRLVTEKEEKQILIDFNQTKVSHPIETTLHQLFARQAATYAQHIAVESENQQLTYEELDHKATQLARVLRHKGVQSGHIVGIMVERSLEMMIGIMGILKAGGAYLPLDPSYPKERINYMVEDSGVQLLLVQAEHAEIGDHQIEQLCVDQFLEPTAILEQLLAKELGELSPLPQGEVAFEAPSHPSDVAYVIYTSGSTGKPKGVMIEHRSVLNFLYWSQREYPLTAEDRILQKTPFTFDASIWELFWWMLSGARVCLLEPGGEKDPAVILQTIEQKQITMIHFIPSMLSPFVEYVEQQNMSHRAKSLKQVFSGGEALSPYHAARFIEVLSKPNGTRLSNTYGPTEATVNASHYRCPIDEELASAQLSIGKPIDNYRLYIVDSMNHLQPIGVMGELCISGVGLARGYINNPELTAERFVDNPYEPGRKMYRTGDVARWLPEGEIEFLGRTDDQVKIRGYRIELGEIENQLLHYEGIMEAIVLAQADQVGDKWLCVYFTAAREVEIEELKQHLAQNLPSYMIPSSFAQLEKMPVTTTGKVDRTALAKITGKRAQNRTYIAPSTELEKKLVSIWQEVLTPAADILIGVDDDFFDLGGHSLKATNLVAKIYQEFQVSVPLKDIFQWATIRELAQRIHEAEPERYRSILQAEKKEYYAVSSAQKRVFVLSMLDEGNVSYNMPSVLSITGRLEQNKVQTAFQELIKRHDTLRTSFEMIDGQPVQRIYQNVEFQLSFIYVDEDQVEQRIRETIKPFHLAQAPLFRATLLQTGQEKHYLILDMHHIISDGTSLNILTKDFTSLYYGNELPELNIQYKDFSEWQNERYQSEYMKKQESFWLSSFEGEIPVLDMPTDFPRPSVQRFEGDRLFLTLDKQQSSELYSLARSTNTTLFMVLLSAYYALLSKYTGQEDIVVGIPIAGRQHPDLDRVIGMFVNTLALRNQPDHQKTYRQFLLEVKRKVLEAYEYQDYPFEELVERLDLTRNMNRNPLFDTMFALQNTNKSVLSFEGLELKPYPLSNQTTKFDLTLNVYEDEEGLHFLLEYSTSLFKKETMERFLNGYEYVLEQIMADPEKRLDEYRLVTEKEEKQILVDFNQTKVNHPIETTLHQLFARQAATYAQHIAVESENQQLTYEELDHKATQLARVLRHKGVQTGHIVGIMVERSLEMMIGIMGILKAGGAYLPLDPSYPKERITYMVEDSGVQLLLVQAEHAEIGDHQIEQLCVDRFLEPTAILEQLLAEELGELSPLLQGEETFETPSHPSDIAYVIYTSGSTGKPKGVMIEHRSVLNFLYWSQREYPLTAEDRILQKTPFTFDASIWELFWWMLSGARVCLLEPGGEKDPAVILQTIEQKQITMIHFIPSMLYPFVEYVEQQSMSHRAKSLKQVFSGGEALSPYHAARFIEVLSKPNGTRLSNTYGPTEATVNASHYRCPIDEELASAQLSIGKPIDNYRLYIVDPMNHLQPIGVMGELCISGVGLARGYINNPELTAERFVDNPYEPGRKMYRTGDVARWLPEGEIEFLGRTDDQVKIRGYRIELGEIENQLLHYEEITEAIVLARDDHEGNKALCAYYTAVLDISATDLREFLARKLPGHMVPSYFVQLRQIPLTATGKVDRLALPQPTASLRIETEYLEPDTKLEKELAEIWQQVLGVDTLGLKDHFFELGGDSIKAIQVSSRLYQMGYKLEIKDLFRYPRMIDLVDHIVPITQQIDQGAVEGEVMLTPIQRWFFEQAFTEPYHWNQAVMLFREQGFCAEILQELFSKIVEHHDALRLIFEEKEGRYVAWNRSVDAERLFTFDIFEVPRDYTEDEVQSYIQTNTNVLQSTMNLTDGPLVKIGLFQTDQGDHLLISIHHLVVDGISWRILFEDIATGYQQASRGEAIALPPKTDSFKTWSSQLDQYANLPQALEEYSYWKNIVEKGIQPLPQDYTAERSSRNEDIEQITIRLSTEETDSLLKEANKAYNTEINDLLLTALGLAIAEWSGMEQVIVNLEGHGREELLENIDVTRTVGWFTSQYPIMLDVRKEDLATKMKRIKEELHRVPAKGIGYGILRYLTNLESRKSLEPNGIFALDQQPQISFNYLGQFDEDLPSELFQISPFSQGNSISPHNQFLYLLNINGLVGNKQLQITFDYSRLNYCKETIEGLGQLYKQHLLAIIKHCTAKEDTDFTPSDFLFDDLSMEDLLKLEEEHNE